VDHAQPSGKQRGAGEIVAEGNRHQPPAGAARSLFTTLAYDLARRTGTFHDLNSPDYEPVVEEFVLDYTIDAARDLNGVRLVFFASFASIIDSSLLKLWKHLGRDVESFLNRVVRDRQICYTANAENDSNLRLTFRSWRRRDDPREEIFNVVIREPARDRLVLVSTLHIRSEQPSHANT